MNGRNQIKYFFILRIFGGIYKNEIIFYKLIIQTEIRKK